MYIAQSFDKKGINLIDGETKAFISWEELDLLKKGEFVNQKGKSFIVPRFELYQKNWKYREKMKEQDKQKQLETNTTQK